VGRVSSAPAGVSRRAYRARARARRRRLVALAVAVVLGGAVAAVVTGLGPLGDAVRELTLPLRHDDIIRQQAADKNLDPALIAAVIYEESRFRDQTSHAGARGLMQITPETADFIARRSGGNRFVQRDLATPQINIAYGSYYLRYLIDHYGGNETLAIAAYNAGQTNVDRWVERAGGPEVFDSARHIPFPETRAYVKNVSATRESYREHYADDLGL
jgi:soluble lytic murein transglycosylase